MKVPLLDLTNQYFELKKESDALWFDTMEHASYVGGPRVLQLENDVANYVGTKNCIACANGTDALFLIMEALGVTSGDEVITTPWTFFATLECIVHLGAKPVMVDIDPQTFNIDPIAIEKAITPKTKAIIPVHIYGQVADMDAINEIANKHKLFVVEDACQAMGAEYKGKKAGSLGKAAAFSFFPTKNLGCAGDGGCVTTDDDALAERIRLVAGHGMPRKYIHTDFGVNSRLDALQAGLLSLRLTKLDEWNEQRISAAKYYNEKLAHILAVSRPSVDPACKHIYHLYILKTDKAPELQQFLSDREIGSALYYPKSLHEQECFLKLADYVKPNLPVAEAMANHTIALPCYPGISRAQQDAVIEAVENFFN